MTAERFPPDVVAAACAAARRWHVPASVTLAQWALESAFGRAMPQRSNNPFGIKARRSDPYVVAETNEVVDGRTVRLPQRFRAFPDLAAAFEAHARLLAEGMAYAAARAVRDDPKAFARALTGHYATDPNYGDKLIALMERYDLASFDALAAAGPAAPQPGAPDMTAAHPSPTLKGVSMLTNKWIQFGLSTAMAVLAGGASLDWSTVLTPSHAAGVATGIATVKALLNLLAPGPRVPVQPTGGRIITHTEI